MSNVCPNCGSKARVYNTDTISRELVNQYCRCSNPHCNAKFVVSKSFSHYVTPPEADVLDLAAALLKQLPEQQRQAVFERAGMAA